MAFRSSQVGNLLSLIFRSKASFFCLVSLFTQQAIVAFSTLFIILLGKSIAIHNPSVFYLLLFMLSLMIVYLPGIASLIYLERAKFTAFNRYVLSFSTANKNNASLFNNQEYRHHNDPWLTNESFLVIEETTALFYNWISTGCNAVFNIAVIGFLIEPLLFFAYSLSFFLLILSIKLSKKPLETAAISFQKDRNLMNKTLLSGADNILIANLYNLDLWLGAFNKYCNLTNRSAVKLIMQTNLSSAVTMCLALLPIAFVTIWFFYANISHYAVLATLIVTLPRQIQVIQNIFSVFSHAMEWHGVHGKLKGLMGALQAKELKGLNLNQKIKWENLIITYSGSHWKIQNLDEFLNKIQKLNKGRMTIRAPNGSGKSVLLSLVKEQLSEQAFLLPSTSHLLFDSIVTRSVSQGEKTMLILNEIHQKVRCPFLLLDEWDANLDNVNKQNVSNQIDLIASERLVVEIRHRSDD